MAHATSRHASRIAYKAEVFIRCHCENDNDEDSKSEVSAITFIPSSGSHSSLVVTCGGNSICLIDPASSKVIARYAHPSKNEKLTCLTWTINDDEETILASGGSSGCINLINICNFACYFRWNGHDESITALTFHPSESNYLFSSSLDKCIKIWNITENELCKDPFSPILQVDAFQAITTFAYSPYFDLLLAGGEKGLVVNANVFTSMTTSTALITTLATTGMTTRKRSSASSTCDVSEATRPRRQNRSSTSARSIKENASNGNVTCASSLLKGLVKVPLIDSLVILPSYSCFVAVKAQKVPQIFIWSIGQLKKNLIASHKGSKRGGNLLPEIPIRDFITFRHSPEEMNNGVKITSCKNLLACGDAEGNIWIYDLDEHISQEQGVNEPIQGQVKEKKILTWPTPDLEESKKLHEKPTVKCIAFSNDLEIVASGTTANLICLWKKHK